MDHHYPGGTISGIADSNTSSHPGVHHPRAQNSHSIRLHSLLR